MIASRNLWLGLGISALFLGLFAWTVDLGRMLDALAEADYIYLAPGIGLYLVSVLFRTFRWQVLLRHMRPISIRRLYPVVVVGYMANNLLPLRLGELLRSYYVGEREGISKTSALATIFIERVLDALTLLFFVAVIALFVPVVGLAEAFGDRFNVPWPFLVLAFSAPFVVAFGTLLLFAAYPERARALAIAAVKPLPDRSQAPLHGMVDLFLDGLMPLRSPQTLTLLLLLSVPVWLFESGLFFLVGYSFGLHHVYENLGEMAVAMVLVTAIANIGSSVPAAPGGVGLFELVALETVLFLPLAAVEENVAAAFAAVVHATLLLPMIALGQLFLWRQHLSLARLSKVGRAAHATAAAVETPARGEHGLTQAALAPDGDEGE